MPRPRTLPAATDFPARRARRGSVPQRETGQFDETKGFQSGEMQKRDDNGELDPKVNSSSACRYLTLESNGTLRRPV